MEGSGLWEEILEYARWSPSPHNTQPWKVKLLSAHAADLFYDPARLLPEEDPPGAFMTVGMAIFVEMLAIAARAKGYDIVAEHVAGELKAEGTEPRLFAHLRMEKAVVEEPLDRELILRRRTSRVPYDGRPVEEEALKEFAAIATGFGDTFSWSSDPALVAWIVELNKDTMFYDMDDAATRREVGGWIRYSPSEAASKKDGLWARCMNVAASVMYVFFNARWVVNIPGLYAITGKVYLKTMKGTNTVAWLQGPFATPEDWMRSGRMLARIWLAMTKRGIALHPFGSIITNKTSHARLREKFHADERSSMMWLIMRLGRSAETPPRSYRLGLEEILIK